MMQTLHRPSDNLAIGASWAAVRHFDLVAIRTDRVELIAGVSIAGYQLPLTMALSYVQWLAIPLLGLRLSAGFPGLTMPG